MTPELERALYALVLAVENANAAESTGEVRWRLQPALEAVAAAQRGMATRIHEPLPLCPCGSGLSVRDCESANGWTFDGVHSQARDAALGKNTRTVSPTDVAPLDVAPEPVRIPLGYAVIPDACYCSDFMSSGLPCLPGRCPNVPKS